MGGGSDSLLAGRSASVELPYPPSVNTIYRRRRDGQVVLPAKVKEWKRRAGWAYKAAGGRVLHGAVSVEVELYPPADGRRRDIDNGLKCILDSFNGVAWRDDDQVSYLAVAKLAPEGKGRAVVRVKKLAGS
jgi:Holliday junction resolvase RusA-like endonuclease